MAPDRLHANQLVMRSLEILVLGRGRRNLANPLTTLVLAPFVAAPPLAGVLLWNNPLLAFGFAVGLLGLFWAAYFLAGSYASQYRLRQAIASVEIDRRKPVVFVPSTALYAFDATAVPPANVATSLKVAEAARH